MRDWAFRAGLLVLDEAHIVRARDPELVARFKRDAGVRPFVRSSVDETAVSTEVENESRQVQDAVPGPRVLDRAVRFVSSGLKGAAR